MFTPLNGQIVLFLTIQFSLSHLFAHSLNMKQFYLTHRKDPIRYYYTRPEETWKQWQWMVTPHFIRLQEWSFITRLFIVISRAPLSWDAIGVFNKPRREKLNLLIAAQNKVKRTNYVKGKINNTQKNSMCRLCGYKYRTVNHIISECSKVAQKEYKTKHNWVEKVIHWKLCNKIEFNHTDKWYMHKPESLLYNEMHKIHWTRSKSWTIRTKNQKCRYWYSKN